MKLSIPQPCPADWENMRIGLISRHCESCQKDVMDFTKMSREEIIFYLFTNRGQSVCGRFQKSQLDYIHLEQLITISALRKLPRSKSFAILTIACMLLASCNTEPTTDAQTIEIVADTVSTPQEINPIDSDSVANHALQTDTTYVNPGPGPIDPIDAEPDFGWEMGEVIVEPYPYDTTLVEPPMPIEDTVQVAQVPFTVTEVMPEFPGGMDSLFAFIHKHLEYPADAHEVQGRVYARFVVEADGSVTRPEILRSVEGYPSLDSAVLKTISQMPNWIPGQMRGKAVPVYYTLTFSFNP